MNCTPNSNHVYSKVKVVNSHINTAAAHIFVLVQDADAAC